MGCSSLMSSHVTSHCCISSGRCRLPPPAGWEGSCDSREVREVLAVAPAVEAT